MRLGNVAGIWFLGLSLGCGQGSAQQTHAESPTTAGASNEKTSSEPSASNEFRSEKYAFRWKIPDDWEFVPPDESGTHPGLESAAARAKADDELLIVRVTDVVAVVPGKEPKIKPHEADDYVSSWMESEGIRKTGSSRLSVLETDAIRFDGVLGDAQGGLTHATIVLFYKNRRRFELRCYATRREAGTPCDDAVQGLVIDNMPDSVEPGDTPRVLHLRAPKYQLQFDAPDDTWLAIGPRIGGGGTQVVWIWNKEGRQIDLQVLDLANVGAAIDEATFVEKMAAGFRKPGATVTVKRSELSGRSCGHIEIGRGDGWQQDMFLQKRGALVYGLLVTARERDPVLIERAKAGLKIATSD